MFVTELNDTMKYDVINFIKWGLRHTVRYAAPADADMPLSPDECGIHPTRYLFGTVWKPCTRATLNERFVNHYAKQGYSEEDFDRITSEWSERDYATDCQGLLDAWLTVECNEKTDINAHMNYTDWCTDKGAIADINRPYVVGEAVFMQSKSKGKMTHVGWICGKLGREPLVLEARGLRWGVVITKLSDRPWTHRGLMTKKFDYGKGDKNMTKFEVASPMHEGEEYKKMQAALNAAGYTDEAKKPLVEDGKWGKKSQFAFERLLENHAESEPVEEQPVTPIKTHTIKLTVDDVDCYECTVN